MRALLSCRALALVLPGVLALAQTSARGASVINSKHDLSADSATSGPKAAREQDTCLFCHVPHKPAAVRPLWNRPDSQVTFTFYSSNYLNNYLGQRTPTMADLNASRTKLCLSCHDGVTAIGALYNIAPGVVEMTGSMSASSLLGSDLSNDHPVLYDVKPGAGPPTQPGTNPEMQLPPPGDKVKVYGDTNRVECASCHDPHDDRYGDFLVKPNAGATLCTTCHQKTGYMVSAHATSNVPYTPPGGQPTSVGENSCRNCHKTHGASGAQAYILQSAEEATCYTCHGSPALPGAKSLKPQFTKAYRHPTEALTGAHLNPELDSSNLGPGRRHAECWDCHNPHRAQTGTHASPGNLIGKVLLGQWGVEPSYGTTSPWQAAVSYVKQIFNDVANYKQYQLCFKCHTYYAFGSTPAAGVTDQSVEYNPYNRSAHPVRNALNEQTGSTSPKPLTSKQMSPPWNVPANLGNQTMACSDCHGSELTSDVKGPHGSMASRLVKGPRLYWPKNASGELWTLNDIKKNANNWSNDLFCVNCHPLYSGGTWKNEPHQEHEGEDIDGRGMRCILCHAVVPHGAMRSRLIVYSTDPAPYNYSGAGAYDRAVLLGFKKASGPFNYGTSSCYSPATGCHPHNSNIGGYDP